MDTSTNIHWKSPLFREVIYNKILTTEGRNKLLQRYEEVKVIRKQKEESQIQAESSSKDTLKQNPTNTADISYSNRESLIRTKNQDKDTKDSKDCINIELKKDYTTRVIVQLPQELKDATTQTSKINENEYPITIELSEEIVNPLDKLIIKPTTIQAELEKDTRQCSCIEKNLPKFNDKSEVDAKNYTTHEPIEIVSIIKDTTDQAELKGKTTSNIAEEKYTKFAFKEKIIKDDTKASIEKSLGIDNTTVKIVLENVEPETETKKEVKST